MVFKKTGLSVQVPPRSVNETGSKLDLPQDKCLKRNHEKYINQFIPSIVTENNSNHWGSSCRPFMLKGKIHHHNLETVKKS
jgi:hypothetical protein